jgi:hypothetical protein
MMKWVKDFYLLGEVFCQHLICLNMGLYGGLDMARISKYGVIGGCLLQPLILEK